MAGEIRIDKKFSGTGHAAEANLYPRGVNTFRQTMVTPSPVADSLLGTSSVLDRAGRALDRISGHIAQIQRETDDYNDDLALLKMKNAKFPMLVTPSSITTFFTLLLLYAGLS